MGEVLCATPAEYLDEVTGERFCQAHAGALTLAASPLLLDKLGEVPRQVAA